MWSLELRIWSSECAIFELGVENMELIVQRSGFRVEVSEDRIWFGVSGLGIRGQGSGLRVQVWRFGVRG